jgi:hypothetical protein
MTLGLLQDPLNPVASEVKLLPPKVKRQTDLQSPNGCIKSAITARLSDSLHPRVRSTFIFPKETRSFRTSSKVRAAQWSFSPQSQTNSARDNESSPGVRSGLRDGSPAQTTP